MEIFRNIDIFLMQRGFNCRAYSRGLFYFLEGVRLLKPGKPILGEAD
jgi:hypothetical protein